MVAVLLREPNVLCVTGQALLGEGVDISHAGVGLDERVPAPFPPAPNPVATAYPAGFSPSWKACDCAGRQRGSVPAARPARRAITALLAATDYNGRFRGGWFLLARRGDAGRPVAPCLGGQNDRWYGSAGAWAAVRAARPCP